MLLDSSMIRKLVSILGVLALIQAAQGVVVISGDPNNTPGGQPYLGNIGTIGGGSGIYLWDRWVMSAAHVAGTLPTSATFGGSTYPTEAGTFHRLANPTGSGLSTLTDIVLFRLGTDPGLPPLALVSSTPVVGAVVTMIGGGRVQEATPTYWHVDVGPLPADDTWTPLSYPNAAINAAGFLTTETRQVRWGENQVSAVPETINYGAGDVRLYATSFDVGALAQEAQAVSGDSGGAVFVQDGGQWLLAGMMVAVETFEKQPFGARTAVIGNTTLSADLSFYRSRILEIVPEPSSSVFCLIAATASLIRRRRD